MDFYRRKDIALHMIQDYLSELKSRPENFTERGFQNFLNGVSIKTGLSLRTITGEFEKFGVRYDSDSKRIVQKD